jgi:hypothetical protein
LKRPSRRFLLEEFIKVVKIHGLEVSILYLLHEAFQLNP